MSSTRGQSETVGFALLLVLTIISVGALAVFGGAAVDSAQQQIGVQSAEHAMSQFDSRVAMVGLGRSDVQTIDFGQSQKGTYTVEPGTGRMVITHYNYTAGTDEEEIYNQTLGSLVYTNGDTEIAYQGGGVWRMDSGATMISPPEFHYRGATLTLPVLQVDGEGSVAGTPSATIRKSTAHKRIYPDRSKTYDGSSLEYTNPIGSGNIEVTVHSKYYEAWGDYFRTRTDGNVTLDHQNTSATMELVALGTYGDFDMPLDGNSMTLRGIRTHQISNFNITLFHDDSDSAKFSNLDWSMYATSGSKEFEINVVPVSGTDHDDYAKVTVYYSPNGVDYEGWMTTSTYQFEAEDNTGSDWNGDGDDDDKRLVLNFTSQDSFEYQEVKTGGGGDDEGTVLVFDPDNRTLPGTIDEHQSNFDWEPRTYDDGDSEVIQNVTTHYIALMGPTMDLYVEDPSQNTVEERISYGTVEYEGGNDFFLTYLHVTENEVNITVR